MLVSILLYLFFKPTKACRDFSLLWGKRTTLRVQFSSWFQIPFSWRAIYFFILNFVSSYSLCVLFRLYSFPPFSCCVFPFISACIARYFSSLVALSIVSYSVMRNTASQKNCLFTFSSYKYWFSIFNSFTPSNNCSNKSNFQSRRSYGQI